MALTGDEDGSGEASGIAASGDGGRGGKFGGFGGGGFGGEAGGVGSGEKGGRDNDGSFGPTGLLPASLYGPGWVQWLKVSSKFMFQLRRSFSFMKQPYEPVFTHISHGSDSPASVPGMSLYVQHVSFRDVPLP
jgi:hypothetical protein